VRLILDHVPEFPDSLPRPEIPEELGVWGFTHAALQIGPVIFDWDVTSFCVPRSWDSKTALCCVDVCPPLSDDEVSKQLLTRLCRRVAEWNRTVEYRLSYGMPGTLEMLACYGNCQAFVQDLIFNVFSVSPRWADLNKPLGLFLKSLKSGENALKWNSKIFNNHKELDDYWIENMDNLQEEEKEILRAIDRAFVLRGFWRDGECPYTKERKITARWQSIEERSPFFI